MTKYSLVIYIIFAFLRLFFTVILQPGYIHPDEYFQSTDILLGDIFTVKVSRVWEFNKEFPIRNVAIPYLMYGIPLIIVKYLTLVGFSIPATPYLFVMLPRLICCCSSFLIDFSLYKICQITKKDVTYYLLLLSTSYVMLVYATRTFSNTIEMTLTSVLLYLIIDSMKFTDEVLHENRRLESEKLHATSDNMRIRASLAQKRLPSHSFRYCILIAIILVIGFFNRPTFLAYALIPVFYWLHRGVSKYSTALWNFHLRILSLAVACIPLTVAFILIDSIYYGYTSFRQLLHAEATLNKSYVITPYNFVRYNSNSTNLSNHGLHPWFTHFLINIPILFNILGICFIVSFILHIYRFFTQRWSERPKLQNIDTMLVFSFVVPICILSIFPHQEPRFLLPLILPIILLQTGDIFNPKLLPENASRFRTYLSSRLKCWFLVAWSLCNLISFVFYCFFHQAGIYPMINDLSEEYRNSASFQRICVITSHLYPIPISLIYATDSLDANTRYINKPPVLIYNLGSEKSFHKIPLVINKVKDLCKQKNSKSKKSFDKIYFLLPTILSGLFHNAVVKQNITYVTSRVYYPHFSTEALTTMYWSKTWNSRFSRYDSSSDISEQSLLDYIGLSFIHIYNDG